jgi:hypothetical protein
MQKVILVDTGEEVEVSNNVAHGMIEKGYAVLKKNFIKPPKDKMVTPKKYKIQTK